MQLGEPIMHRRSPISSLSNRTYFKDKEVRITFTPGRAVLISPGKRRLFSPHRIPPLSEYQGRQWLPHDWRSRFAQLTKAKAGSRKIILRLGILSLQFLGGLAQCGVDNIHRRLRERKQGQ